MRKKRKKSSNPRQDKTSSLAMPDMIILGLTLGLLLVGIIMVLDASIIEAFSMFSNKYYFVRRQLQWVGIGLISMTIFTFVPLSFFRKWSQLFMVGTLLLLVAVLLPGVGSRVQGASRWIVIGGFVIQPSELAKLAAVLYFPDWLSQHQRIGAFSVVIGIITVLLLLEPDLGTAIIIFGIAFSMYIISGANIKHISWMIFGGGLIGALLIITSPYRLDRLKTFVDPTSDPLGSSYHIRQVLISLGSGGLMGTGFGRSRQKFQFLPEATTDSIFAVIGEETGFLGASIVVGLFAALIFKFFKLIPQVTDQYAQLVIVGVMSWIGIQTLLNLSAMVALVPLTGVPLPFISYGGSSLVTMLSGVGLALNASRYRKRVKV
jgi:cell division protein FtsW